MPEAHLERAPLKELGGLLREVDTCVLSRGIGKKLLQRDEFLGLKEVGY